MNIPEELRYTKSHEWLKEEDGVCTVGLTDFAQHALGDITYVELPAVGDSLAAGQEMGVVESVKAASDLYSPVAGEVIAVNETLNDTPELVNRSPYDQGWMVRVKLAAQPAGLLSAADYEKLCQE